MTREQVEKVRTLSKFTVPCDTVVDLLAHIDELQREVDQMRDELSLVAIHTRPLKEAQDGKP